MNTEIKWYDGYRAKFGDETRDRWIADHIADIRTKPVDENGFVDVWSRCGDAVILVTRYVREDGTEVIDVSDCTVRRAGTIDTAEE